MGSIQADEGKPKSSRGLDGESIAAFAAGMLRAVTLHPAPDRCVIDVETTLLQQLLNIAK
jgi:hypothetical protein